MVQFGSLGISLNLTRLQVQSRQSAEPQTGPSVQVQKEFEFKLKFFVYKKSVTLRQL